MIEPAPRTVDEVDALLEDPEDDPVPVDSVLDMDADLRAMFGAPPRDPRAGIWSCY